MESIILLKPIILDNINNQLYYKLETEDKRLKILGNIMLLLFANIVIQRWQFI